MIVEVVRISDIATVILVKYTGLDFILEDSRVDDTLIEIITNLINFQIIITSIVDSKMVKYKVNRREARGRIIISSWMKILGF